MPPFVIFALPRSRTAWLSHFLSGGGASRPCGHDIAITLDSAADAVDALHGMLCGTVETAAMPGWRSLRAAMPEARFLVLRRDAGEVEKSLAAFGMPCRRAVLDVRSAWLDEIAGQYGTETIDVAALDDPAFCAALFERLHGIPCPGVWLAACMGRNIQIHAAVRRALIVSRVDRTEALRAEAELADRDLRGKALPFAQIAMEPWSDAIGAEARALTEAHSAEVGDGADPRRPLRPDGRILAAMQSAGQMTIHTARLDGVLVGYLMWTIGPDPESAGLTVANQGPWFVVDSGDARRLALGRTMFERSIEELRRRGVKCVFPHHRVEGRGARLGSLFRRMGAKEIQHTYQLWIGE